MERKPDTEIINGFVTAAVCFQIVSEYLSLGRT